MHDAVELRAAHEGPCMTWLKNFYIKIYQHKGIVKYNPLYEVMHDTQLQHTGT